MRWAVSVRGPVTAEFLDHIDVPSDDHHAEREIRPSVIMRKNGFANSSERGMHTQEVQMTVLRI